MTLGRREMLLSAAGAMLAGNPEERSAWVLEVPGGRLEIRITGSHPAPPGGAGLEAWIRRAAEAVSTYYGRFPAPEARLTIRRAGNRSGIWGGVTYGTSPPSIEISVGGRTSWTELQDDWILTHEMVHLAFPSLAPAHRWLEEGLATYVEPLARVQARQLAEKRFWQEFLRDLPQGVPGPGDGGLDQTRSWARTYWGGALFCFCADLAFRLRTGNRHSLQTALQAVVTHGGNVSAGWPLQAVLHLADQASGEPVLTELYERWKSTPVAPDLDGAWRRLGVRAENGEVVFDDAAPLASIRSGLVRPPSASAAHGGSAR